MYDEARFYGNRMSAISLKRKHKNRISASERWWQWAVVLAVVTYAALGQMIAASETLVEEPLYQGISDSHVAKATVLCLSLTTFSQLPLTGEPKTSAGLS